jgi:hypothetical protein
MVLKEKINDSVIKIIEIVKIMKSFKMNTLILSYLMRRVIGNKIVQRFYETPEGLSSGSNNRKAKFPIPAAPKTGFTLYFNKLGELRNFYRSPPVCGTALSP